MLVRISTLASLTVATAVLGWSQSARAECPTSPTGVGLYTTTLSHGQSQSVTDTLQFADVDGDGEDDMCYAIGSMVRCYTHHAVNCYPSGGVIVCDDDPDNDPECGFGNELFRVSFGFNITANPKYADTLAFPDLDDDGDADVCLRGPQGIECAKSTGGGFTPRSLWSTNYSDGGGWDQPYYYETIAFPDLDNDGRADVCGRGFAGYWCALSTGNTFSSIGLATQNGQFSNAGHFDPASGDADQTTWSSDPRYYSTLQFADIDNDGDMDLCGRGSQGIYCALYNRLWRRFDSGHYWADDQYRDADGWGAPQYYSTVLLGDINADGAADVCGRGSAGIYCGRANVLSESFSNTTQLDLPFFNDANMGTEPRFATIVLTDTNGDGAADVCGRGAFGIYCSLATGHLFGPLFQSTTTWIDNFGDNFGWGMSQTHWGTVQPANVDAFEPGTEFCGRGHGGILCSER